MFATPLVVRLPRLLPGLLPPLLFILASLAMTAPAHADGAFRTVLVIDASSSMRRTDPGELRKVAAELFVDLARDGDQIAVTGFDESARQSTGGFVTITGPDSRARVKDAIRAVGNDGEWTDFTAGLSEARSLLESADERPGDQELIVFLTDGRCEPDPEGAWVRDIDSRAEREALCKERVLGDIAQTLGGARVYAIGLSRGAPKDFLEELGRRTGGRGQVTLDPRGLPALFAGVYANLLGSRLEQGDVAGSASFEVYEGAETLDLVIVGRADKTGTLTDPAGAEVAIDNRAPDKVYFVAAREYRFYKIRGPAPGTWTLTASGQRGKKGKHRYASLQHFDLALSLVDMPAAIEKGQSVELRARLASPSGATPPAAFLDRHRMTAIVTGQPGQPGQKPGGKASRAELVLERGDDGAFTASFTPAELGVYKVRLVLEPGSGGVLSRATGDIATLSVIPPVYVRAAAVDLGAIKQGAAGQATLSLAGSKVGVPLTLALALAEAEKEDAKAQGAEAQRAAVTLEPQTLTLAPDGEDAFELSAAVGRDAPPGPHELSLRITPTAPEGFGDRAITVPVTVDIVALSFWERYGRYVQYGGGALLALILLLGVITPAKFKKRAILYYADVRDLEMIRRSSYPLGVKARRGFYRGARLAVGPTGPVKKGGAVVLRARPGGAVEAVPASASATVRRTPLPAADEDDFGAALARSIGEGEDRPRVPLREGGFRVSAQVGYEIEGSGLVFWYK